MKKVKTTEVQFALPITLASDERGDLSEIQTKIVALLAELLLAAAEAVSQEEEVQNEAH